MKIKLIVIFSLALCIYTSCCMKPVDTPPKETVPDTLYLLFYERPWELDKDTSVFERENNRIDSVLHYFYSIPKSLHYDFAIPFSHNIGKDSVYYKPYDYFFNSSKELKDPLWIKNKYISTDSDFMGNYDRDKRTIFIIEEDFEAGRLKLTQVHYLHRVKFRTMEDYW